MYKYEDAISLITGKFPTLRVIYENNIEDYDGLPYVFYESVFVKYILTKIQSSEKTELQKIFTVIEEFFKNGDEEIKNLIGVAVVESLFYEADYKNYYKTIFPFFGEMTKQSFDDCII